MKRYFTPEQADRLLPFIKQSIARLVTLRSELEDLVSDPEAGRVLDLPAQLRGPASELIERIHGEMRSLQETGILIKGLEAGLVDFWARKEGREVFLCWRLGEGGVGWWHEVEGGFSGRKPLQRDDVFRGTELN
jgi:hypothetical protein